MVIKEGKLTKSHNAVQQQPSMSAQSRDWLPSAWVNDVENGSTHGGLQEACISNSVCNMWSLSLRIPDYY